MTSDQAQIVALGDAIVDVLAQRDEDFLVDCGVLKGTMRLLADQEAEDLAAAMHGSGTVEEVPGGSAANSLAGAAALGARCRFIGLTGNDRLGELFKKHMADLDIVFDTPPHGDAPTGRCFILVTPDGERTMQTSPAASHCLTADALDEEAIRGCDTLFLEGYLWGPDTPRAAMRRAIELARGEGRRIAFTLSDSIALPGRRDSIMKLVSDGGVDVLFANEYEAKLMTGIDDFHMAVRALGEKVPLPVVTCGAGGAVAVQDGELIARPAVKPEKIVDTTGAGDQFAAGFLAALIAGRDVTQCLDTGARNAAAVLAHMGARPLKRMEL
ncbi:adenosine kinase [Croceicoccus mobilis]|uniref:Adenosine kinase n=1 Tax=Croceicoccus mobilis TaxID=1703339 RepID=A0A916YZI1_9SPHN|nr:adenosine kinase [Croceicoccus mobilis]GGD69270.1 adenosine kinase [Croceicoccus mobilis]